MTELEIRIISEDDEPAVIELLRSSFYVDEPMFRANGWVLDEHFIRDDVDMIGFGISLKAVDGEGKIVGILLSEIIERDAVGKGTNL